MEIAMDKTDEKQDKAIQMMERLLSDYKTASLASVSPQGHPQASYAPVALSEKRDFYIFISELSEHTGNLREQAQASLMFIEDECESKQLFARNRLTVQADTKFLERESEEWDVAAGVYRNRFGSFFDQLSQLRDFHMVRLRPNSARVVIGFGGAFDILLPDWSRVELVTNK